MLDKITLITGLIGSGKTLRAVWYIDQEIKSGRAVYVCNLDGLNVPGAIPFDDPRKWRDLPPGSLLVVDEAQRYWRARRSGEVPPELQDMETSRHDAVSLLLLTQQPSYLDKHLRGLVTRHEHLYRRMGAPAATLYVWERCVEDVNSVADKEGADQSIFVYPKHLYGAYKSADTHTTKVRLGFRAKLIIAAVCLAAGLLGTVFYRHSGGVSAATPQPAARTGAWSGAGVRTADARPDQSPPPAMTAEDYVRRFVPRIAAQPYSAPAWDDRKVVSDPQLVCIIGETCHCVTEQGTKWKLPQAECRAYVLNGGVYNPFKRPTEAKQADGELVDLADTGGS